MEKPNAFELRKASWVIRDTITGYLKDRLHEYTFQKPYECHIPVSYWCSFGLSSLELPAITAMCYDEEYDEINIQWEGEDCWVGINDMNLDDLIELLEGFE